ncbi:two-component system response regulator YesN [Paenibacillus forsythiae]|uniref:Two-component system response regulator YesN n=1 Tax=Paenibacillus forsythiae TaxID=365616 RepID=A0ABU3H5L2_9BACL|nr:response regulator [Paenibacillus forsythiae]MDT3425991.1 two-component system response regulator YesN [Paenibacillus forsythiae]
MYKVMIADDEPLFRYYMRSKLDWSGHGFTICCEAANGREALEEAKRYLPDLALIDISMPYMNGLELAEKLKVNVPGLLIVFVTGHNEFEYAQKAVRLGVHDYLLKPFDQREFTAMMGKVRETLRRRDEATLLKRETGWNEGTSRSMEEQATQKVRALFNESSESFEQGAAPVRHELHPGTHETLLMALKMRDHEAAADEIGRTLALFRLRGAGDRFAFTVLMSYVSLCLSHAGEIGMNPESLWAPAASPEQRLRGMASWEEAEDWIAGMYDKVIGYRPDARPSKSYNLFLAAKGYIHRHYSDPELTVDQVASGMYVDSSYLRKVFRKEGAIAVLDYITYTRMKRAKELLADGNVKLAEIAERVGYADPNYFSKSFKKHYGIPPSEFEQREIRIRHTGE